MLFPSPPFSGAGAGEANFDDGTDMIQCRACLRWAHDECARVPPTPPTHTTPARPKGPERALSPSAEGGGVRVSVKASDSRSRGFVSPRTRHSQQEISLLLEEGEEGVVNSRRICCEARKTRPSSRRSGRARTSAHSPRHPSLVRPISLPRARARGEEEDEEEEEGKREPRREREEFKRREVFDPCGSCAPGRYRWAFRCACVDGGALRCDVDDGSDMVQCEECLAYSHAACAAAGVSSRVTRRQGGRPSRRRSAGLARPHRCDWCANARTDFSSAAAVLHATPPAATRLVSGRVRSGGFSLPKSIFLGTSLFGK